MRGKKAKLLRGVAEELELDKSQYRHLKKLYKTDHRARMEYNRSVTKLPRVQ